MFLAYHKLFIRVKMNVDMQSNFAVWDTNSRGCKGAFIGTSRVSNKAKVFKVVDPGCVDQLNRFEIVNRGTTVVIGKSALEGHIVVFHASTDEILLKQRFTEISRLHMEEKRIQRWR